MKTLAWILLMGVLLYPPRLTIVPAGGSIVSDVVEVRVTADQPLQRAEFLLDGKLVGSDTSTPYTWLFDTLSVSEGEHVLTIRITDQQGRVASVDVTYRVDNALSRGGTFYLEEAQRHLSDRRWDDAVKAARRAAHLLPDNAQAHLLLARSWLALGQWGKALQSAGQANKILPSIETFNTLAETHLRMAFREGLADADRFAHLEAAVEAALRAGSEQLTLAKTPEEKAQALARLGKLEEAASALLQAENNAQNLLLAARYYLLAGQWQDADRMCNLAERRMPDKTTLQTLRALVLASRLRLAEARQMLERLEPSEQLQPIVVQARANVALRELKASEALRLLVPLRAQTPASDALETLLMGAYAEAREFPLAEDSFRRALLNNPLNWMALAQKGYETLAVGSISAAQRYFRLAAKIRGEDSWVLCGQALCEQDRRVALTLAQNAARRSPADPWTQVVLSYAQSRAGQMEEAFRTIVRLRNTDREHYNMASPPDARRAGQIARTLGRRIVLRIGD